MAPEFPGGTPYAGAFAALALARIYAIVDDRAAAIAKLDTLLAMPSSVSAPLLRVDPTWARLRGEPGLRRLLDRYGGDRHGRAPRAYFDAWTFSPIFLA